MSVVRIEELLLPYDPQQLAQTVARRRRRMIGRAVGIVIGAAVVVAVYVWRRQDIAVDSTFYWIFTGVVSLLSVIPFVVLLVGFLRARRELKAVPRGTAVRMGRPGVVVADRFARWADIASLEVLPGGLGRAERLWLRTTDGGASSIGLDQVVVHPATLDSTARAYSGGRRGVDLSRLDN